MNEPRHSLEDIRGRLKEEAQDDLSYLKPQTPSQLAGLSNDELMRLYRKHAFSNLHQFSVMLEHEMRSRLIAALGRLQQSSEKASQRLERLTWALVILTIVIAFFTVALFLGET